MTAGLLLIGFIAAAGGLAIWVIAATHRHDPPRF